MGISSKVNPYMHKHSGHGYKGKKIVFSVLIDKKQGNY